MEQITQSNTQILTKWVKDYADQLFSYTLKKIDEEEVAKDLVQETFIAAFQGLDNFKSKSQPKTWLFSILKNKIAQFYRAQYKKDEVCFSQMPNKYFDVDGKWIEQNHKKWGNNPELSEDEDFKKVFRLCIANLPKSWQAIIKSKFFDMKKGKEICDEFEITEANYWQLVHRSKLNLRECLTINWFNKQ